MTLKDKFAWAFESEPKATPESAQTSAPAAQSPVAVPLGAASQMGGAPLSLLPLGGPPIVATVTTRVREDMVDDIRKAVFGGMQTAYMRLLDTAEKMRAAIPDDYTRLKAAASVSSVSAAELRDGLARHHEALNSKRATVTKLVSDFRESAVVAKQRELDTLASQRADLVKQIQALDMRAVGVQQEIAENTAKGNQTEADFNAAIDVVDKQLAQATDLVNSLFPVSA